MLVDQRSGKEKRARLVSTRPEPTINGNCESWNFIVGKLHRWHSADQRQSWTLQLRNTGLSTSYPQVWLNLNEQMGFVCDSWLMSGDGFRMVKPLLIKTP